MPVRSGTANEDTEGIVMYTRLVSGPCHPDYVIRLLALPILRNAVRLMRDALWVVSLYIVSAVSGMSTLYAQDSSGLIEPSSEIFSTTTGAPAVSKSFAMLKNLTFSASSTRLISLHLCQGSCVTSSGELGSDNVLTESSTELVTENGRWSFTDTCESSGNFCQADVSFTGTSPGSSSLQLIAEYETSGISSVFIFYEKSELVSKTEAASVVQTISIESGITSGPEGTQVPIIVTRSADPCCSGLDELVLSLTVASSSSAVEGVDFSFASNTDVFWGAGETGEKTVLIDLLADTVDEEVETIDVVIDGTTLPAQAIVVNRLVSIDINDDQVQGELITEIVSGTEQGLVPGLTGEDLVLRVTGDGVGQPGTAIRIEWSVVPESAATLSATNNFVGNDGTASNTIIEVLERGFIQVFATATVESIIQSPPNGNSTSGSTAIDTASPATSLNVTPRINPPAAPELASNVARFILRSGFFPATGLTENQSSTGTALDNACTELQQRSDTEIDLTNGQDDLLNTCSQLDDAVVDGTLGSAINRLKPEEVFAMADSSVEASDIQVTNVFSRINALRSGSANTLDFSGLSLDYRDQHIPGAVFNAVQGALAATSATNSLATDTSRLGIFATGRLSVGEIEGADNQKGADFSTQGVTIGADYRVSSRVVLGGSLGFTSVDTDFQTDQDSLAVEGVFVTLFGTWYSRDVAYVDAVLQAGNNEYDSVRRINLPENEPLFANGSTDAQISSFTIGAGRHYSRDKWEFGPYLRATITSASVDGYTESTPNQDPGFGSILMIGSHSVKSTTVTAGVQVSASVSTRKVVLVPQFWIEGEFETETDKDDISATFVHDPTNSVFSISGDERDSSYVNYGLGSSIFWPGFRSVFAFFESQLGHDYTTQYWLKLGTRFNF